MPTWTKSFTYLGDSALSTITPNGQGGEYTEYNHPDRLGTRVITNQQSGTSYEQTTLPFGTALNAESTVSTNKKRFTSYDRSAQTGLDYAVNRTYDSKQGRFTQVDPIKMGAVSLVSPQTLNLYTYCGNDPINHTDSDGLFFGSLFKWIGKIFKIILIAVAVFIAVAAMIAMPSLAPQIGYGVFAKLFALSGALLAQALAPPKIGAIIGIIVGLVLMSPGVIVNLAEKANKIGLWQKLLSASNFVGAVSNSFADKDDKKKKKKKTKEEMPKTLLADLIARAGPGTICGIAIAALIEQMAKGENGYKGKRAASTDIEVLFNRLKSITFDSKLNGLTGRANHRRVRIGPIEGGGTSKRGSFLARVIHEITHTASVKGIYDDVHMGRAAHDLLLKSAKPGDNIDPLPMESGSAETDTDNFGRYAQKNYIGPHCNP